ncbi:MAG: hypothetical protein AUJ85_02545 [Elusimicrobia bacterium CG1_02_37_114]|nr:MAG: hypothetical protein AUJ85_02545 [Elusimicrobia bacterium CG1_02_37_114]
MKGSDETIKYVYKFNFEDGKEKRFEVNLNPVTFNYIPVKKTDEKPEWAKLNFHQCQNCPLDPKTNKYCPIAVNLVEFMEAFKDLISYKKVNVVIETKERDFTKTTSVQDSISSLLGIYMVTSGCPNMNKLKPMVRFHLPLATSEETIFRSISIYLLGQYFLVNKGKKADWGLEGLKKFYKQIELVNLGMVDRVHSIAKEDAVANALVKLDVFAKIMPYSIQENLCRIEYLFSAYFE